jgi:hypothetical protein
MVNSNVSGISGPRCGSCCERLSAFGSARGTLDTLKVERENASKVDETPAGDANT